MGTMQCRTTLHFSSLSHFFRYLQRGETLVVPGPDELSYGRILRLQEEYVVGIGGLCNPINEWSTVDSYSRSELNLLSELASGCKWLHNKPGPWNLQLILYIYDSAYIASCWIMTILKLGSLSHPTFSKAFSNFSWPLLECVTGSTATVGIAQIS